MPTIILLKNNEITKNTIMGGNIDVDRYIPAIKAVQKTKIKQLLGKELYDKICTDFSGGTLTGLYKELYEDYVKELVIQGGSEIYLSYGAYMVTNNGITKGKTETTETISKEEVDFLVQAARRLYNDYERELLDWFKTNGANIPEYASSMSCGGNSNRINVGGWALKRTGLDNNRFF